MATTKRLALYAADAYRLSSLLLRRVLLTKPANLASYREKTRQLLLDQSRPSHDVSSTSANVAAVKLLEWDKEWNLVKYYGAQEYAKRWWASQSWSLSISSYSSGGSSEQQSEGSKTRGDSSSGNVARVAFMITTEQRHKLSKSLGYTTQDIRTFKPIEALLLLEHGVKKEMEGEVEYDFRAKLKELVEENERLDELQHQMQSQLASERSEQVDDNTGSSAKQNQGDASTTIPQSVSSEAAEHIHVKADVAVALLSAEREEKDTGDGVAYAAKETSAADLSKAAEIAEDDSTANGTSASTDGHTSDAVDVPASTSPSSSPPSIVDITPDESEELHMKPDVAAAILTSKQTAGEHQQLTDINDVGEEAEDGPCWYEVIERVPSAAAQTAGSDDEQSPSGNGNTEHVIALFPTREEALECARIKQSFRRKEGDAGDHEEDDRFLVRRRWNA